MIRQEDIMPLAYFKKEAFTGSDCGMRYRIEMREIGEEDNKKKILAVTVWPQPLSYECTADDLKEETTFTFDGEGRKQILPWLLESYEKRRELYESVMRV